MSLINKITGITCGLLAGISFGMGNTYISLAEINASYMLGKRDTKMTTLTEEEIKRTDISSEGYQNAIMCYSLATASGIAGIGLVTSKKRKNKTLSE